MDKQSDFVFIPVPYQGPFTPQNLLFNANLQELAQRFSYICGLESTGRISLEEAHTQIKILFNAFEHSTQNLGFGER